MRSGARFLEGTRVRRFAGRVKRAIFRRVRRPRVAERRPYELPVGTVEVLPERGEPMYNEEQLRAMEIEPAALVEKLKKGAERDFELVDVRERMELDRGVLPGAKVIPMSELDLRVAELPREREIVFYCEHGIRSLSASAYFHSMGYNAKSLSGGFAAWRGPVEK